MSEETSKPSDPEKTSQAGPEPDQGTTRMSPVRKTIDALGVRIAGDAKGRRNFTRGEVADLRRLDPAKGPPSTTSTFWRVVVEDLESRGVLGEFRDSGLREWMVILQGLAELEGLHDPRALLGVAMARAEVSEARLTRLLRARGPALAAAARQLAHQLKSRGQRADWSDVATLVLSDGRDHEMEVRHRIARHYYRAQHQQKTEDAQNASETTGATGA